MSEININTESEQLSAGLIITVLQDVVKGWYLMVMAGLVAAMITFMAVDFTYQPIYRTSATFVVSSGSTTSTTYNNLSSASNTATVFTELLNSSILRKKVLEEMDMTEPHQCQHEQHSQGACGCGGHHHHHHSHVPSDGDRLYD